MHTVCFFASTSSTALVCMYMCTQCTLPYERTLRFNGKFYFCTTSCLARVHSCFPSFCYCIAYEHAHMSVARLLVWVSATFDYYQTFDFMKAFFLNDCACALWLLKLRFSNCPVTQRVAMISKCMLHSLKSIHVYFTVLRACTI